MGWKQSIISILAPHFSQILPVQFSRDVAIYSIGLLGKATENKARTAKLYCYLISRHNAITLAVRSKTFALAVAWFILHTHSQTD